MTEPNGVAEPNDPVEPNEPAEPNETQHPGDGEPVDDVLTDSVQQQPSNGAADETPMPGASPVDAPHSPQVSEPAIVTSAEPMPVFEQQPAVQGELTTVPPGNSVPSIPPISTTAPDPVAPSDAAPGRTPATPPRLRPRRRPIVTRRSVHLTGRVLASIAAIALLPASVWAALALPQLPAGAAPASVVVQPGAALRSLVCAGPARLQENANGVGAGGALGTADVTAVGASAVNVTGLDGTPRSGTTASGSLSSLSVTGVDSGSLVSAVQSGTTLFAAAQSQMLSNSSDYGYAATSCVRPTADAWLVGGETTTGRVALVRLLNPSASTASVVVTPYTASGAAGSTTVSVPAHGEVSVPVSALAPGGGSLAIHVVASGASVGAFVQQTSVNGLTPVGLDMWGYGSAPSTTVTIPGVVVTGGQPTVRLLSLTDTSAQVSAVSVSGVPGSSTQVTLKAGEVVDVPLAGLANDSYVVLVSSDALVSAAVSITDTAASSADFGWIQSAAVSASTTAFSVPVLPVSGQTATVTIYPQRAGTVTLTDASGATTVVAVSEQTAASIPVTSGGYTLESDVSLAASVTVVGGGTAAGYPISIADDGLAPIVVFP